MPRQDAISDKRKEQLQLENDQLQKLMFQARSSARRSSLKEGNDETAQNVDITERDETLTPEFSEDERIEVKPIETISTETIPQLPNIPNERTAEPVSFAKKPLTEKDLFPEESRNAEPRRQPEKASIIQVILPSENIAAPTIVREREIGHHKIPAYQSESSIAEPAYETEVEGEPEYREQIPFEERQYKRRPSRTIFYSVMFIAALAIGFGAYYFYYQNAGNPVASQKPNSTTPVSTTLDSNAVQHGDLKKLDETAPVKPMVTNTEQRKTPNENTTGKTTTQRAATTKSNKQETASLATGSISYKVRSKAYFYNTPDESTRRKAFIIHWNNAVLTPQNEKNDFIYVVFTNHLGQTSKGWLRKKDLIQLN